MNFSSVEITKRAVEQIQQGSLWIFANEFVTRLKAMEPGSWVRFEYNGRFIGTGYVNPHSLIAGRICSRDEIPDRIHFLTEKIHQSLERRNNLCDSSSRPQDSFGQGSFRAVFSEGDELPGLIVDVYGEKTSPVVVAQITTAGMESAKENIITALKKNFACAGLVLRCDSSIRKLEGLKEYVEVVVGQAETLSQGQVREGSVNFAADFVGGQKTGFFLDQRENRARLGKICRLKPGAKVLDLCCYSGGWGLTALKNGAGHVTFVDQSQDALNLVQKGLGLNDFSKDRASTIAADIFDFLETNNEKFDVVIADPPAFVKSKKNLAQARKAYAKLNFLALKKLRPGGILFTCSCSFHLSDAEFEEVLTESLAKAGTTGTVVFRGQQSGDHPWVLNRPETRYLKCLALRIP